MLEQSEAPRSEAAHLGEQLAELATVRNPASRGYTRRSFTPEYLKGRELVAGWMKAAGLSVRHDAAGNLIGSQPGSVPGLAPLVVGSHTDTVEGGGRFDGMVGVLGAIEAVRVLNARGIKLRHSVEVVDWLAEEVSVFGISTVGSRTIAGHLTEAMLATRDEKGRTLAQAIGEMGGHPQAISSGGALRQPGEAAGYLELHIEQSRRLVDSGNVLGVVSRITGIRRFDVTVQGEYDHAGGARMSHRHDALTGAAELILALEDEARQRESRDTVGTVGKLQLSPNVPNVVPGEVWFTAEMRSIWDEALDEIAVSFAQRAKRLAAARDLNLELKPLTDIAPVVIADDMQALLAQSCQTVIGQEESRKGFLHIPSGAGHDANHMALICPTGMLFVPSIGGKSHCPEEETDLPDIALGVDALIDGLLRLDKTF